MVRACPELRTRHSRLCRQPAERLVGSLFNGDETHQRGPRERLTASGRLSSTLVLQNCFPVSPVDQLYKRELMVNVESEASLV